MDFNFDITPYKPFIAEVEQIGLPILTPIVTAAATGAVGPFGMAAPMVLNGIVAAANTALGIDINSTPQQAADAIAADPDAAKDKLAAVQEDHAYLLAQVKQADDTRLAAQAQQTALLAIDAQSGSTFSRAARPAIIWGLGALVMLNFGMPDVIWFFKQITAHVLDPFPPLDTTAIIGLFTLLGATVAARSADKVTVASAAKAIVAPKVASVAIRK